MSSGRCSFWDFFRACNIRLSLVSLYLDSCGSLSGGKGGAFAGGSERWDILMRYDAGMV